MNKNRIYFAILCCLIQVTSLASSKADVAFELFQSLKGSWEIQSEGKKLSIEMTYDIGSRDSIITEQFGKELSVFYKEGDKLLMTHYCNVGNQPHLKLKDSKKADYFEFETVDVANLIKPEDAYVQKIIYKVIDKKHIDLELVWQIGKKQESEKYKLTRKP